MLDIDAILRPWYASIEAAHGPFSLFDAHTHIGANDPDGFKQTPEELIAVMERADSRAVVFPMHEPDGYSGAERRRDRRRGRVPAAGWWRSAGSTRATIRRPRRAAAWTRARSGSSCTRAPSSSRCPSRACARSSRSRTSGASRC